MIKFNPNEYRGTYIRTNSYKYLFRMIDILKEQGFGIGFNASRLISNGFNDVYVGNVRLYIYFGSRKFGFEIDEDGLYTDIVIKFNNKQKKYQ